MVFNFIASLVGIWLGRPSEELIKLLPAAFDQKGRGFLRLIEEADA